jgi:asparagine synthase (glutamine-hydrolysing)
MIQVSGGLDSSSIAGAADSLVRSGQLPAPSILGVAGHYPGLECDETEFIDAVARRSEFPIERWNATESEPSDLTDPKFDEPGRTASIDGTIGDIAIARAHSASVILTGVGGDQLGIVGGVIRDMLASHDWTAAIEELLVFPNATMRSRIGRLKNVARQSAPSWLLKLNARRRAVAPSWLAMDFRATVRDLAACDLPQVPISSFVQKETWQRVTSAQTVRVVSMLCRQAYDYGREYRFPFLDRDLVQFILTIPYEFWPRPGPFARFHRRALADLLPSEVASRFGKADFTEALANRVRRAQPFLRPLLEDGPWASERYVRRDEARRFCLGVINQNDTSTSNTWRQVWAIVTLEAWMRKVLEYHPVDKKPSLQQAGIS